MNIPQTHIDELVASLTAHLAPEDITSDLQQLRAVIPDNEHYSCALTYVAYFAGIHADYQQQIAALTAAKRKDRTAIEDCKAAIRTAPSGSTALRELNNAYRQVDDSASFSRELWECTFNPKVIRMYATAKSVSTGKVYGGYGQKTPAIRRSKQLRSQRIGV